MKTNNKIFLLAPLLLLLSIIVVVIKQSPMHQFYLEDKYYSDSKFIEIETNDLNKLINNKESFVLFIYQPACITSSNFEQILYDYLETNHISIYKIPFSDIKNTTLSKSVKYYPSFAIFNNGKLIDYLDANSDEDLEYYESKEGFEKWFTNYVLLKQIKENKSGQNSKAKENNAQKEISTQEINLNNVTYNENKVNIYFFWGSTCPHCKEEFAFFDEIKETYGKYYNLYTYEVWENPNNAEIMNKFSEALGEEVTGVPYTIIGDKSFKGFGESSKEEIMNAIKNNHQNSSDIYFNKIKN